MPSAILTPPTRKNARDEAAYLRRKEELRTPVGFARGVLGHSIWAKQAEIMEDVASTRRVAVKSCNASGKTFITADIALWWITTFSDGIAVTTAPTWTQVSELLWGEIRNTVAAPKTKVKYGDISETKIRINEKNYAIGLSTNQSARFSGFHSGRVLILMDEAEGILPNIWEAINGLRAGGEVRQLAIGNPLIVGGDYYDIFTTHRAGWKTHTISAFDTPNFFSIYLDIPDENGNMVRHGRANAYLDLMTLSEEQLDCNTRPYLCTRRWVKEMHEEWGPLHPYFQSRVLGEFPTQGDDALIPLSWLEKMKLKEAACRPEDRVRAGLDVAGPGEAETVLTVMKGDRLVLLKCWPQADPRGEIVAALMPYKEELESLNVDSIGVGWGIYLHLSDIFDVKGPDGGVTKKIVNAVNVGSPARDDKKFANAKAEYFWNLRLRCQAGELLGLTDEKAIGQLAVIKYRHNSRGKIEIESKGELVKRGVKALAIDTPIPTPDGWAMMGDLEVGDVVFDEEGRPTEVIATTPAMEGLPCYAVRFSDGNEIVAEEGHLWKTRRYSSGLTNAEAQQLRRGLPLHQKTAQRNELRTTWEIGQTLISQQGKTRRKNWWNHQVPLAGALYLPTRKLPLSPYVLGYWLGNGDSDSPRLCCNVTDTEEIAQLMEAEGIPVSCKEPRNGAQRIKLGNNAQYGQYRADSCRAKLSALGVLNQKHIPLEYMRASISQRTALLCGLLDSDGTIDESRGRIEISSSYPSLAEGIEELILSLGIKPSRTMGVPERGQPYTHFQFIAYDSQPVFQLKRKRERQPSPPKGRSISARRSIVACELVESVPVRCITVAAKSGMFLAGKGMIPTHNSPDRAESLMLCDARPKKSFSGFALDLGGGEAGGGDESGWTNSFRSTGMSSTRQWGKGGSED